MATLKSLCSLTAFGRKQSSPIWKKGTELINVLKNNPSLFQPSNSASSRISTPNGKCSSGTRRLAVQKLGGE